MNFIHSFMRAPLWVREDLLFAAVLSIAGWVIIWLVIRSVVRFFKKLINRKETQK